MIGTTGPKISSRMIRISSSTPASTVGAMNLPLKPGTSRGPPATRSAPPASASSTSSVTTPNWSSETIGPISVSHSIGSPTVSSLRPARRRPRGSGRRPPRPRRCARSPSRSGRRSRTRPRRSPEIALSRSASAQTICGSLPPSSSTEPFSCLAQISPDLAADLDRAGEEDLPRRRLAQRLADRAAAVDDPHQALGQARLLERLADPLAEQRRQARRLEDDAVAGHQRHRHLVERDRPRVVPGRDHPDDAERLVAELRLLREEQGLAHADRLVGEDLRPVVGAPVEDVDRRDDLHRVALGDRLALLAGEELGDLVDLLDQHVGGPAQVAGAVGERELRPERLHLGDVVDDRLHLVGLDRLDRADQLAGRRVEGLELPHQPPILWLGPRTSPAAELVRADRAGGPRRSRRGPP